MYMILPNKLNQCCDRVLETARSRSRTILTFVSTLSANESSEQHCHWGLFLFST